ncbi:protein kinase [Thalassoglobus sp. JC818]|uniref:protein kinase domain-containing protein n=1 Tax=Thalassoglobus sp. JC818 TaxID=3232136 RepID=UPI00345A36E6
MPPTLIGQPAPTFRLQAVQFGAEEAEWRTPDSYAGEWLILLFYPRDFSFVCPTELTAFSAHFEEFRLRNCQILGISVDTLDDHRRWFQTPIAEGGIGPLRFPLASDQSGEFARACGVWLEDKQCAARGLLIIDPDGVVQYFVAHNTSVGRNSDEVLRVLDAVQSGGLCPESWAAADGTIDIVNELKPGRVLGQYRLVSQLGAGGFGNVFLADDLTLKRRVALKVIRATASSAREQVIAEARAAASLNHPNVCTVFAVETIGGLPMIVMEYVEGVSLSEIDLSSLASKERSRIAVDIASGLAEAHAHGIVHGDLKPANVIVASGGRATLLDFGLARHSRDGLPQTDPRNESSVGDDVDATVIGVAVDEKEKRPVGALSGTPRYMSPEQTLGERGTTASDIYSFGLILFELISTRPAIPKLPLLEILDSIRSGRVREQVLSNVEGPASTLLAEMLATDPDSRPAAKDVKRALSGMKFEH